MNLPEAYLKRMKERLGTEFPAFLRSYETPPRKGLRVNTLKIPSEEFFRRAPFPLGEQVGGDPACVYVGEEKPGADPYHFAGLYYVQEPSAMKVGDLAGACKKERVLDLCAAPGGKTTHIAALMAGRGVLVANEIDGARAKILSQNVERMGIANCAVTCASSEALAVRFPSYFDLILVDAPCSGEGMFKKEPNAVPEWSEENVARCAARQRGILDDAATMLAGGGRYLYSTCTFAEEEDEWQIRDFLNRQPEFSLAKMQKLYPHTFRGEGHFCALLEKREGETLRAKPYPVRRDRAAEAAFAAFAEEFFTEPPQGEITVLDDGRMYLVPAGMPDLSFVRLVRLGVELGEWDGKIFKPAHALAMAFGAGAKRQVRLSREEAKRYLRGEAVEGDERKGWRAVCVEEFPLGLGKCVDGVVKNYLPKGLRLLK